jgi:methylated-DNA-[protein]-cysteine S-methyltransferase
MCLMVYALHLPSPKLPMNTQESLWIKTVLLGGLLLCATREGLTHVHFMAQPPPAPVPAPWAQPLLHEAARQIQAYCAGRLRVFSLPLSPAGTAFQHKVWQALLHIAYGTTCSYAAVAKAIGQPQAARAVGRANNANPLPILIPCHRVIGASGKLVGYADGLAIKQSLLLREGLTLQAGLWEEAAN